jgi:hypothetical protein
VARIDGLDVLAGLGPFVGDPLVLDPLELGLHLGIVGIGVSHGRSLPESSHHQRAAASAKSTIETNCEIESGVPRAGSSSIRMASSKSREIGWSVSTSAKTAPVRRASGVNATASAARSAASIAA